MIEFFVPGNPKAQMRHRTYDLRRGGRVRVDPSKADKQTFLALAMQHRPPEPLTGPLCLRLICVFPRPQNHYHQGMGPRAGQLRTKSPFWRAALPDWDNVGKFVCDALNGVFWRDDRLIVSSRTDKLYGEKPGIYVRIWEPTGREEMDVIAEMARVSIAMEA